MLALKLSRSAFEIDKPNVNFQPIGFSLKAVALRIKSSLRSFGQVGKGFPHRSLEDHSQNMIGI